MWGFILGDLSLRQYKCFSFYCNWTMVNINCSSVILHAQRDSILRYTANNEVLSHGGLCCGGVLLLPRARSGSDTVLIGGSSWTQQMDVVQDPADGGVSQLLRQGCA